MKKSDLKKALKPIVKECINEVLLEQGLLSTIITEVVKGLEPIHRQPVISTPNKEMVFQQEQLEEQQNFLNEERHQKLKEQKRKLLDAAGFKTDIFAGTEPITGGITTENKEPSTGSPAGTLAGVDPHDPGVDITGLAALAGRDWKKMI